MLKIRFAACLLAGVLTAGTLGTGAPLIGQAAPAENRNENIEEMSAGTIEESGAPERSKNPMISALPPQHPMQ